MAKVLSSTEANASTTDHVAARTHRFLVEEPLL